MTNPKSTLGRPSPGGFFPLVTGHSGFVVLKIVIPTIIEPLQRGRQGHGPVELALLLDDPQPLDLVQCVADLEIHLEVGVALQVHLDIVVEHRCGPALWRGVLEEAEGTPDRPPPPPSLPPPHPPLPSPPP